MATEKKLKLSWKPFLIVVGSLFVVLFGFQNCKSNQLTGTVPGTAENQSSNPNNGGGGTTIPTPDPDPTPDPEPPPPPPVNNQPIQVNAVALSKSLVYSSEAITYTLNLKSNALPRRHKILVQLIDPQSRAILVQDDFEPNPNATAWAGDVVINRNVQLPANLASSHYDIEVRIYDPFTDPNDSAKWTRWPTTAGSNTVKLTNEVVLVGTLRVIKVVQTETMSISPSGGQVSDPTGCLDHPSGDLTVMGACTWGDEGFFTGSYVDGPISVQKSGSYQIKIFASGEFANNAWPLMEVKVDGLAIGPQVSVTNGDVASSYTFTFSMSAGSHQIRIAFTNDYYDPVNNIDRNLFLDRFELFPQ